jgi:hypothetical protein
MHNPNGLYIPEIVGDLNTTLSFLREPNKTEMNSFLFQSESSGVYLLQMAEALRAFALTGDFKMAYHKLKEFETNFPKNKIGILPLSQHDEFYIGYVKEFADIYQKLVLKIKENGGVIFKNGNSAAGSLHQILGDRFFFFYKLIYGLPFVPYTQFGTELDLKNNWSKLYKDTEERLLRENRESDVTILEYIQELRRKTPNEPPPTNLPTEVLNEVYADARGLGRFEIDTGSVSFKDAQIGKNKIFNFVTRLTAVRYKTRALESGNMKVLETYDRETTAILRKVEIGNNGNKQKPSGVLILGNGSNQEKVIEVHVDKSDIAEFQDVIFTKMNFTELEKGAIMNYSHPPTDNPHDSQWLILSFRVPAKEVLWLSLN